MAKAKSAVRSTSNRLNLQNRRVSQGLSLEAIAENTKISIRFLRAIEDEEFDKLPGGIFDRSYLRQYAAAVGFDEAKLLAHYSRNMDPETSENVIVPAANRGLLRWLREATAGR